MVYVFLPMFSVRQWRLSRESLLRLVRNSGQPNIGIGYEADAIAACVIGGASMNGGPWMYSGNNSWGVGYRNSFQRFEPDSGIYKLADGGYGRCVDHSRLLGYRTSEKANGEEMR